VRFFVLHLFAFRENHGDKSVTVEQRKPASTIKSASESVSRIWISDLQTHNLRRINERFVFCDLWRRFFLMEVKTSDMFLACSSSCLFAESNIRAKSCFGRLWTADERDYINRPTETSRSSSFGYGLSEDHS
jgi:hypothetical protein